MWLLEQRDDGLRVKVEQVAWVKVGIVTGIGTERFWCKVVQVQPDGECILATVDNDIVSSSLKCGDQLLFKPHHVLETASLSERFAFLTFVERTGPRDGAIAWQKQRIEEGVAVAPKPDTNDVLPM